MLHLKKPPTLGRFLFKFLFKENIGNFMARPLSTLFVMTCLAGLGAQAMANNDTFPTTPPIITSFDAPLPLDSHELTQPIFLPPTISTDKKTVALSELSTDELTQLNNLYAEDLIGIAITKQNWQILTELLEVYKTIPDHDTTLYRYAMGAIARKGGKQKEAIALYQDILRQTPDLPYVKFDLALMLLEDKQTSAADRLFAELQTNPTLTPETLQLIKHFRTQIIKSERITPHLSLNYEATDNVNNASSTDSIEWLGRHWQKSTDSLPQAAHGIRYALGIKKKSNIIGNHNLLFAADDSGVYYWDNERYNEHSFRLSAGYQYQDLDTTMRLSPFSERTWLDGERYTKSTGLQVSLNHSLTPTKDWQLSSTYSKKSYDSTRLAARYDGYTISLGASLNQRFGRTMVYGGLDSMLDNTKDKELTSRRYGIRAGVLHNFDNGLGMNLNARYAYRVFDAPATLVYNFVRKDHEQQANLSLWHKKLAWYGMRPQFNLRHMAIDSNMPAFYSRDGLSYFVSVDKDF